MLRTALLTLAVVVTALFPALAGAAGLEQAGRFRQDATEGRAFYTALSASAVEGTRPVYQELERMRANGEVRLVIGYPSREILWDAGPADGGIAVIGMMDKYIAMLAIIDGPCIDPLWSNEGPYATELLGDGGLDMLLRYACPSAQVEPVPTKLSRR